MHKRTTLFGLLALMLLVSLACRFSPQASPTAPATAQLPAGQTTISLTHASRERSYILYVPASVDWSQPVALVFVFHGGTGNAESAVRMSGFNEIADRNGFLVVYPNGTGRLSTDALLTWNAGDCCGYARTEKVDDVGFVRAIAASLQAQMNIDARRVYATGLSNGAMLSQRLACEAADLFAAVAPVAGTLNFSPCQPSQPVSLIGFHGTADQHVPYDGGFGPQSLVDVDFASVPDTLAFWASFNSCAPQPTTETSGDIRHETWSGCAHSSAVELYTVIDGGHAWPGGRVGWPGADEPTQSISASQLIWDFFAAHPRQ